MITFKYDDDISLIDFFELLDEHVNGRPNRLGPSRFELNGYTKKNNAHIVVRIEHEKKEITIESVNPADEGRIGGAVMKWLNEVWRKNRDAGDSK